MHLSKLYSLHSKISKRSQKFILALVILGTIIGVGCSTVFRAGFDTKLRTDLTIYKEAAEAVLEGKNIYTAENERTWYFTSPPIVAILCIPLTWTSITWDAFFIYILSIGMIALVIYISRKLLKHFACESPRNAAGTSLASSPAQLSPRGDNWSPWSVIGISLAVCSVYFSDVLTRGQFGILVLLCLLLTLYGWILKKPALAGLALGFAISIKITPAALLPLFFVLKKEFRILVWSIISTIAFSFVIPSFFFGTGDTLRYLVEWTARVPLSVFPIPPTIDELYGDNFKFWRQIHDPFIFRNQSLYAVLVRLFRTSQEDMIERGVLTARLAATIISSGMFLASICFLKRDRETDEEKLLEFCVPIIILLVSSTLAWTHYFSSLYVAYFAILSLTKKGETVGKWARLVVGISTVLMLLGYLFKLFLRSGFILWSALILWAGILWILRNLPSKVRYVHPDHHS